MAEVKIVSIDTNLFKDVHKYVKQEPYVGDDGIYVPLEEYVPEGCASAYKLLISKEIFIEAYNKYINNKED